jgi:hypothetical protein
MSSEEALNEVMGMFRSTNISTVIRPAQVNDYSSLARVKADDIFAFQMCTGKCPGIADCKFGLNHQTGELLSSALLTVKSHNYDVRIVEARKKLASSRTDFFKKVETDLASGKESIYADKNQFQIKALEEKYVLECENKLRQLDQEKVNLMQGVSKPSKCKGTSAGAKSPVAVRKNRK